MALALSIILTLRMPQVLDKLDLILRYECCHLKLCIFMYIKVTNVCLAFDLCSVCTSVLMGGNNDPNDEESRFVFELLCFYHRYIIQKAPPHCLF